MFFKKSTPTPYNQNRTHNGIINYETLDVILPDFNSETRIFALAGKSRDCAEALPHNDPLVPLPPLVLYRELPSIYLNPCFVVIIMEYMTA